MVESVPITKLFEEEMAIGIPVFAGGRAVLDIIDLASEEVDAIKRCLDDNITILSRVSPTIANNLKKHEGFFIKAGKVAKAHFPEPRPIRYPSEPGTIGVNFLIPQAIRYVLEPNADRPAFTSYKPNLWEIDLEAGKPAWLFGDGSNYYRASPEERKHTLLAIPKDSVIEIGTVPVCDQMYMKTEIQMKYSPWAIQPLAEETIEVDKKIYQYNTIAALLVFHDLGFMWGMMPKYTKTSVIKILGIFFYEHEFMPLMKWIK